MSGDLKLEDGMGAVVRLAIQGVNLNELMIVGTNQTVAEHFGVGIDTKNLTDKQIESLRLWILWIAERDNIDVRKGLVEEVKAKGADGFEFNEDAYYGRVKGMWTHTNTRKDKFDMFPQEELLDMLVSL